MKLTTLRGSFGKGKADGAWCWPLKNGSFSNYKSNEAWSWPLWRVCLV